jgi:hydrogenase maturation protease
MTIPENKPEVLVIGVGNRQRGDDAAGPIVAERLRSRDHGRARIIEHSGEISSLIELLSSACEVIIIDAVQSGAAAGGIHRFEAGIEPLPRELFVGSTHALGVAEAIEIARALDRLPPSVKIYGVEAGNLQPGADLSPEVERAADQLEHLVMSELEALCTSSR